jgi:hypothetical protein
MQAQTKLGNGNSKRKIFSDRIRTKNDQKCTSNRKRDRKNGCISKKNKNECIRLGERENEDCIKWDLWEGVWIDG